MRGLAGKILYGLLFVGVLPLLLWAWARATAAVVTLCSPVSLPLGVALVAGGSLVILSGWYALWRHGGGLPMNAFPPPRHVTRGAYRLVAHPIYVGAGLVCFGVAIATGSASGFWLISPTLVLAATALVLGHEQPDLAARFGDVSARPWLSLAPDQSGPPTWAERAALYPMVLLVAVVIYAAIAVAGVPPNAVSTQLSFEARLPVIEWTYALYGSTFFWVLTAPMAARSRRDLRELTTHALLSMALVFPLYLALPLASAERPFLAQSLLGRLLELERVADPIGGTFPSFHVLWAFLATTAWASRFERARPAFTVLALLIAASCVTTGRASMLDVAAGGVAWGAVRSHRRIWATLRGGAERVANSWREWRVGRLRIINHGGWAALGGLGGLLIVGTLVGPRHIFAAFLAGLCGLVGAGLWAQFVEGSPALLRPFGWYGGLLGVCLGSGVGLLLGTPVWLLLGAYCAAGPWVQSLGRLRCLVQGCCHGHQAPEGIGIRYRHARSRVTRLTALGGVPLHPTQLYSILWNGVLALVIWRLWSLHVPLSFVGGAFLILNGLGRFVEEAYRGEPQTPVYAGLRLYQWMAILSVVVGAVLTAAASGGPAPTPQPGWEIVPVAGAYAAILWFALGMDFPESSRRFSRLS